MSKMAMFRWDCIVALLMGVFLVWIGWKSRKWKDAYSLWLNVGVPKEFVEMAMKVNPWIAIAVGLFICASSLWNFLS